MQPAEQAFVAAGDLMEAAIERASVVALRWEAGDVAVIDNWRMLHGRAAGGVRDVGVRTLERVLVVT
jgi:alpha-ketoglutarate-dependent taurine dioxygenase